MKVKTFNASRIDSVFVLAVFCVFAASVLVVLMLSANIYRNTSSIVQQGADEHTCLSYVWSRVKNGDKTESISVGDFQGVSALRLEEVYDEDTYYTWIYLYNGWVRELFSEAGLEFALEDGTEIIRSETLDFEQLENGIIKVTAPSGSALLYPRGRTGVSK